MKLNIITLKRTLHWVFAVVIVIHIITGYGITHYRIVEKLTLGLLTKTLSFKIHYWLSIPVIVLLILHIYLVLRIRKGK